MSRTTSIRLVSAYYKPAEFAVSPVTYDVEPAGEGYFISARGFYFH